MHTQIDSRTQQAHALICNWLLPAGFVVLLIGLAALPERSLYHKAFYALIAAPTLIALALRPRICVALLREPVIIALLMFSTWALISISWSDTERSFGTLFKRPLYIFMLFAACALIALQAHTRLAQSTLLAAVLMLPLTAYSLMIFMTNATPGERLIGFGALDNPLLSSHVFGFFCAFWLALSMTLSPRQSWLALIAATLMGMALLATGSRTPLVATALTCAWLIVACWSKRSVGLLLFGALGALALIVLYPEVLSSRGLSYRPELWAKTLSMVIQQPWQGFGFGAHLTIFIADLKMSFSEPHNFALGVLYYTGIIGLVLWLAMHGLALFQCWKHRSNYLFIVCGALLVYGIGAGLTEGGGILSRPKEHWLVTWIPLALIAALTIRTRQAQGALR
ncbi:MULTISPECIES: O-antigen ligase family protein [Pseudomonas]|jgi:O-antigen ligase|uniref:O-antigen ligase family protein n=1 Tax=Pseudomonas spirodelae TaxID=3101751 RepID=A0ABU5PA91_9PSED|nr:O-antigen ligase family protein [Pseudomonas sp. T5W1]MEA1606595.1 O-antigen ligase family protein [Pseudomonas sp. T5W1]